MTKREKQIYAERREEHESNSAILERDWWAIRYGGIDYCTEHVREIRKNNRRLVKYGSNTIALDGSNDLAIIQHFPDGVGTLYYLISYDTVVATIHADGYAPYMVKEWCGYSKTTMKHINLFLEWMNFKPLSKHDWIMMDVGDKYYRDKRDKQ